MKISENTERKILFVFLIILLIALVFILWMISKQLKQASQQVGKVELVNASATSTSTSNSNLKITYSLTTTDENEDLVKDIANKFMQTKEEKNFEQAKQYMTDDLKSKWSQEQFTGNYSSVMDRFEITSSTKNDPNSYTVLMTTYWKLNSQESNQVKYALELTKKDSDFLVNKFDEL